MKYRRFFEYYAIFEPNEGSDVLTITFPDLPGAISQGDDFDDALYMAADCIEIYLKTSQDDGEEIPEPSTKEEVERIAAADPDVDDFQVVLVRADLKKLFPELEFLEDAGQ